MVTSRSFGDVRDRPVPVISSLMTAPWVARTGGPSAPASPIGPAPASSGNPATSVRRRILQAGGVPLLRLRDALEVVESPAAGDDPASRSRRPRCDAHPHRGDSRGKPSILQPREYVTDLRAAASRAGLLLHQFDRHLGGSFIERPQNVLQIHVSRGERVFAGFEGPPVPDGPGSDDLWHPTRLAGRCGVSTARYASGSAVPA